MQQFNKISLYSNVIKNLLATTYLPLVRSVREGDYICEGRNYVFRCEFIRCTKSGFIGRVGYIPEKSLANWISLEEFHFGDKDGKLSTNFVSNCEGYDYRTHERLGQYLRNLRDMYGLNLLPLYNCFSNQPLENHIIKGNKIRHTSAYSNTKVYKIPIKFNQDYTICIENLGKTTIAPAFLRHNNLVKQNNTQYGNGIDITNQYLSLHVHDNVHNYVNTSFGKPIKVRFDNYPHIKDLDVLNHISTERVESVDSFVSGTTKLEYTSITPGTIYLLDENGNQVDNEDGDNPATVDKEGVVTQTSFKEDKSATDVKQIAYTYVEYNRNKIKYEITDEMCEQFADVENCLYMLIQVPRVFDQNIVVLEGDYTELESQKIVDMLYVDDLPDFMYDKYYIHDLNLMTATTNDILPFSPMLVEFILWNALCTLDTINNDFDRFAIDLTTEHINVPNTEDFTAGFPHFWVPRYRQIISDFINFSTTNTIQDNLGYGTKAVEEYLYNRLHKFNPYD